MNDESLPANYASAWDTNTRLEGGTLFFTGTQAQAVYGGPAPVRALTSPVAGPRRHSAVGGDLGL